MPKVSVITPAYNASKTIVWTIESVLAQTIKDFELIIVDDGSNDDTIDKIKIKAESDSRIKLLINEKNLGVSATRNRAISEATGEWVAFLDSDDIWCKNKLELQLKLAEETNADIVYCSYGIIDTDNNRRCEDFIVDKETDYEKMLIRNVISCSTALIKRKHFEKYSFSTNYAHEDYALWMEMLKDGLKARGNTQVLAYYRLYAGTRSANKLKAAKNRWIIYRKHLKMSFTHSLCCIIRYMFKALRKYKRAPEK